MRGRESKMEIPEDWQTFHDPMGLYSVRFPPDWFELGGINKYGGECCNFIPSDYIMGETCYAVFRLHNNRLSLSTYPHNPTPEQAVVVRQIFLSAQFTDPEMVVICNLLRASPQVSGVIRLKPPLNTLDVP